MFDPPRCLEDAWWATPVRGRVGSAQPTPKQPPVLEDAAPAARGRRAGAAPSVLRDGRRAPDIMPLMSSLS